MALVNYSDLQTAIANFAHRSDLTSIIPDLITLAEGRINGDLDARSQDTRSTVVTVASTETVAAPTDMMNIRALTITSTTPTRTLVYQAPEMYAVSHAYGVTGAPVNFTVIGSLIYLAPLPDAVYTMALSYKARVPSLTVASPINYLLTTFPKVYVTAVMCEVAAYTRDQGMAQQWEPQYAEAIKSANEQDWYSGSSMRIKTDVR